MAGCSGCRLSGLGLALMSTRARGWRGEQMVMRLRELGCITCGRLCADLLKAGRDVLRQLGSLGYEGGPLNLGFV